MPKLKCTPRQLVTLSPCHLVTATLLLLASSSLAAPPDAVTLTETQITIPTYLIGPPDPNPQFYFGGGSQGAQHRIYPYPAYDNLTTEKVDKPYKILYLENQYIKIGILPESGGKIFEAIDKTNGYNFFYRQHIIKPALISLLGAWISGGVEWDVPHHHRATSFLPVQYTTTEQPDGSKTIWVGELELRDRMRWAVGLTLHPGRSYLEASFRMINRTPLPVSMLCFSNVAVHVDDTYQVIFPPSTQFVTYHGKRSFTTWPIATTPFNGTTFPPGTDVSWYKAHFNSNSMFAWNYQDDFFAGYDHGKNAGTMSIADHNVVPGKKFWTWGKGPNGLLQDKLLTDSDGPYIELMVGAYSDNQPDYSWLAPYETRMWTQYWYPFRDIDGVKFANTEGAVNLDIKDGKARLGFYSTADHPTALVSLKLKDKFLVEEQIAINPAKPWVKEIAIPAGTDEHDLRAALTVDSKELFAYSPVKLTPEPMPPIVTNFPNPADIKTNEELYLAGLRTDQFRAPGLNGPDAFWNEGLKRDPNDIRINTALAIDEIKGGLYTEAESHLRKAIARATDRYTTPKDAEPFYYLGLALKAQGKPDEAFNMFSKATWSAAWCAPSYFEIAQIASAKNENQNALTYVTRSLHANMDNTRALALRAILEKRLGLSDGTSWLAAARAIDPLDVFCLAQNGESGPTTTAFPATAVEVAAQYMNAGLWSEGAEFISRTFMTAPANAKPSPLLYYYNAYFYSHLVPADSPAAQALITKAQSALEVAASASTDYAFPFQMEMVPVLEAAIAANPRDSHAPYYLGNLLFDSQPDRAVALWKKSADLNADFPTVYRNLALMYTRTAASTFGITRDDAFTLLNKAVKYGGNAQVFNEFDKLLEENGTSPDRRLEILEARKFSSSINRDDVISRLINLKIFAGKYDDSISLLKARVFRAWEGGGRYSLGDSWINANVLKGRKHLANKQPKEALAVFQAAQNPPATLSEALGNTAPRDPEIQYWIGCANEALGNKDAATQSFHQSAEGPAATNPAPGRGFAGGRGGGRGRQTMGGQGPGVAIPDTASYYQALSFEKLGEADKAKTLFQQLGESGLRNLSPASDAYPVSPAISAAHRARTADAHFLIALSNLGLHQPDLARTQLTEALKASPDHLAAKVALADLAP